MKSGAISGINHHNLYSMRRLSGRRPLPRLIGVRGVDREEVVFRIDRRAMGEVVAIIDTGRDPHIRSGGFGE